MKERGIKGKQPQKTWDRLREFTRRLEMKRRASIPKQGLSDSGHDYYRLIMENSLFIITILNGDGKVMYNSPSIRGVLGYEPGELKGKSFFRLVHPHDLPAFNKNFESGLKTSGAMEYVEYRLQHKDGSWRFLESIGNNLLDDREVRGIVVSSRDVTDHRLAESRLRESEVMYKALVQASPHAVTMADLEGNITFVSPQTLELHGYGSEDELIGTSAFVLIAPEDHQKAAVNLSRTLTEGLVANIDFVFLRKDGSRFIAELNAALIRDSMGRPSSFVAFTRDITARKRMEKELRDRNDELEAFAYTISHDLLTPAAIVEGYAKAALEADSEGRPEAERECLESIMRGARRMSDLIDCLLQYAQAGHMETELELVEPRDILQELLEDLKEKIEAQGTEIRITGDLPAVPLNAMKLYQVFLNLVDNALKHMGDVDQPIIEIVASEEAGLVTFQVSDNGEGIPKELHKKIFEPFKHYSNRGSSGLGIGLATVKRAVEAWGGRVWVESKPREGTTFHFTVSTAGERLLGM